MVEFTTVRVALDVTVKKGYYIKQPDVKKAFLHGQLEDEIYVTPPDGMKLCKPAKLLKLRKGLYGLKQAPRLWNLKWRELMAELGFQVLLADSCVFYREQVWILVYVDDIIIMGSVESAIDSFKSQLMQRLDIKDMGNLTHFLGVSFVRHGQDAWPTQILHISDSTTVLNDELQARDYTHVYYNG